MSKTNQSNADAPPTPDSGGSAQVAGSALERVVVDLCDRYKWTWTRMVSWEGAANAALHLLAQEGLIEHAKHPYGGNIWRVNGRLYGRTDDITDAAFDSLKPNVGLGPFCDLLKAVRKIQSDAEVYGMAGATNHPAVRCEVKGLTLGHWYDLAKAMDALIGPNATLSHEEGGKE